MPSKPLQPPPGPALSSPKDVPKTESPALPVPGPAPSKPSFQVPIEQKTIVDKETIVFGIVML